MQKVVPCLWFDNKAQEAADFYISVFNNSQVINTMYYGKAGPGPEGSVLTVTFRIEGQEFIALNGGIELPITPAISFFVNCETIEELNRLWERLSGEGTVLIELNKYPFSERFGWVADKYGVSWQINLGLRKQKISPFLMFVGEQHGKAEEAMYFYTALLENSGVGHIERYGADGEETEGTVKHGIFTMYGQELMAMDSGIEHRFTFNDAVSLLLNCETQEEVDMLWSRLTEGGEEVECGWLKDKYGVSWQVVPTILDKLVADPDPVKANRVMEAMLKMKKIDVEGLIRAYDQE